jgi:hypothetical protein
MIDKFNRNHDTEQRKKVLNPKCAKQHIEAKSQKNGTDNIILSIKSVYKHLNCYEIKWTNGGSLKLYFNGRYEKYKRNGKCASSGGVGTGRGFMDDGHIVLFINGNGIYFERLIAICDDFVSGKMAVDYTELSANVKDGSGTLFMAEKLGIPMNFHPDNIEWSTSQENGLHGQMIKGLYEKTGHVYRFSSYDETLIVLYKSNFIKKLRAYCNHNLLEVR